MFVEMPNNIQEVLGDSCGPDVLLRTFWIFCSFSTNILCITDGHFVRTSCSSTLALLGSSAGLGEPPTALIVFLPLIELLISSSLVKILEVRIFMTSWMSDSFKWLTAFSWLFPLSVGSAAATSDAGNFSSFRIFRRRLFTSSFRSFNSSSNLLTRFSVILKYKS